MEKRSQGGKRTRAGVSRAMSWGPRLELARGPGAARVPGGRLASPASGRHLGRPLGKRARPGGARSRALCAWPPLSARCHHAAVSPVEGSAAAPPTSSRYSANVSRIDFCRKVRSSVTETRGPHFGGCPGSLRQRPGDAHRAGAPCVPSAPRPSPASQGLGATSPAASSRFGCPAGPARCC